MKAAIFNPDHTGGIVEFEKGDSYQMIRDAVGGIFQAIDLPGLGVTMWMHDEGKLMGLPENIFGSLFWRTEYGDTDHIVGPIILTGMPDAEGDTTGLNDDFLALLESVNHDPAIHDKE